MARDRQRSKQRRRRATGSGGQPSADEAGRDMGLDDATVDEAGLGALGHVSAAGEEPFEPDEDDFERAPDELEGDLVPAGAGRGGRGIGPIDPAVAEGELPPRGGGRRERGRVLTFLRHSAEELRRVQWPDRKHVFQATAVVLGFVLVAGGWLGLMDAIWQPVVNAIL